MQRSPSLLILLLPILGFSWHSSHGADKSDDFLFVIVEDVSAIRFWSDANPNPTRSLESVARDATVFTQAYAPASVCNASRTALLTCQPPELTGIFQNEDDPREIATAVQYLAEQEYRLRAIGKIFHNGFEQDELFSEASHPRAGGEARIELEKRGTDGDALQIGVSHAGAAFGGAALKADRAINWIRGADAGEKNGFFVGFTAPHLPFIVPDSPRYAEAYHPDDIRLPVDTWPRPEFAGTPNPKFRLSARDRKRVISRYLGCLRYVSDEAARVIRAFQDEFPKGHVVFLSDHGFLLDEGRSWGKASTMEAACRVPYFVWSDKLKPGEVTGPVSTGTALPLILDLCGVAPFPGAVYESPRRWVRSGRMPENSTVTTYTGNADWWRVSGGGSVIHNKDGVEFTTGFDDRPLF